MNRLRLMGWTGCGLLVVSLAGCVDQQKEVASYRRVLDKTPAPVVRTKYGRGDALTLEAALLLANRGSEQLGIQGENYVQSLISRDRAYSAFMPTISLAPTYSWQNRTLNRGGSVITSTTGGTGGTVTGTNTGSVVAGTNKYTALDVPVNAKMNIFNGFRDVGTLQAATIEINRQRGLLLDAQATILLETAQTYYNVLLAERSVEVLRNSVVYQEARVADMQNRLRAGIAQPLDLAQSQAQAAATRAQLQASENNVANARTTLAFLANAAVENAALVDRLHVPERIYPPDQLVQLAWKTRPDIGAAASAVLVARENVQVSVGEYYPSVSLNLNYYLHKDTFPGNVEWAGLLVGNIPIFTAGVIQQDVRLAWSQLRQASLQEAGLRRQVAQDVVNAWHTLLSTRQQIDELLTEVAAAQEALRQATQRYQAGLAINLDVLNATDALLSAQLTLATEQFNYKIFYLDLLRATGQLGLPVGLDSMSAGPAAMPAKEETAPILPALPGQGPATQPAATQSQPATTQPQPDTAPAATEPAPPDLAPPATQP